MIEILHWRTFQHYKDRRPPWIKLYDSLLDNDDWGCLDGESAKILIELWLTAGRDGNSGHIKLSMERLAWRLRRDETTLVNACKKLELRHFLKIQPDTASATLAERKQSATPETEIETETEREVEERRRAAAPPSSHILQVVQDLKTGHPDFLAVGDWAIINILRDYPEDRWDEAVRSCINLCAGGKIPFPVKKLRNFLEGKQSSTRTPITELKGNL